jgi:signal transduction histidine kinase
MNISNFIKWISSFFSSTGGGTDRSQEKLNENFTYHKLLEKVKKLEKLMKEESTKTERLKTSFLNNIYHEIRTPMNSIVGFSELLKQNGLSDMKKDLYVSKIKQSSEDFLKLIDLLLDASLVESGNMELLSTSCDLGQLMDELYSYHTIQKHMFEKSDIALLKHTDRYYPGIQIKTDKEWLFKILTNLLDNAFKFTQKGVIEFGYKVINPTRIMFFVKDSGAGIDASQAADMFHKFNKKEYCIGKDNRGLGLGLSIAKALIDKMKGEIWIETNNFGGSTFKFSIPLEIIPVTTPKDKDPQQSKLSEMLHLLL